MLDEQVKIRGYRIVGRVCTRWAALEAAAAVTPARMSRAISVWWAWSSMSGPGFPRLRWARRCWWSSGGGVRGCVFGVMFTPDALGGCWGRISGVEQQLSGRRFPLEEMRQWQAARWSGYSSSTRGSVGESVWVQGCCWLQLAPGCVEALGTDFSAPTIENLQAAVAETVSRGVIRCGCRCSRRMWQRVAGGHFDVVVLNSVVQYFPSGGICWRWWGWRCGCWPQVGVVHR